MPRHVIDKLPKVKGKERILGQAQWLMPIKHFGKLRQVDHEVKRSRQGETPSLLKIQKLAGHGGACL